MENFRTFQKIRKNFLKISVTKEKNTTKGITLLKRKAVELNNTIRSLNKIQRKKTPIIGKISGYKSSNKFTLLQKIEKLENIIGDIFFNNGGEFEVTNDTDTRRLIVNEIKKQFNALPADKALLISFVQDNEQYSYVLNESRMSNLEKFLEDVFVSPFERSGNVSDEDFYYAIANYSMDDFTYRVIKKARIPQDGGYFQYINNTKMDLSSLQIYNKEQYEQKLKDGIENCLISSLRLLGQDEASLNSISIMTTKYVKTDNEKSLISDNISVRELEKVAKKLQKYLVIHKASNDINGVFKFKPSYKGDKKDPKMELVLYKDHYMPMMELKYNKFAIKNYRDIEHLPDWENIWKKKSDDKYVRKTVFSKKTFIDTREIVRELNKNPEYCTKHKILSEHLVYTVKDETYLDDIENEQHEIKIKEKKKVEFKKTFFADCETYTDHKKVRPFLIGSIELQESKVSINNDVESFIQHIITGSKKGENILVYFHNAKFDYSVMFKNTNKISECVKDGQFYQAKILDIKTGVYITIRDSYKHIQLPLSAFKDSLKLKVGKLDCYMPYSLFDCRTIKTKSISLDSLIAHSLDTENFSDIEKLNVRKTKMIRKKKKKKNSFVQFTEADFDKKQGVTEKKFLLEETALYEIIEDEKYDTIKSYIYKTKSGNKKFRHMDFMTDYLKYDCLTLKEGYMKHRQNIFNLCDKLNIDRLDILEILTTSSLAHQMVTSIGGYDGVYEISGNLRRFVQESVQGGRVCTKGNKKHHSTNDGLGRMMDFDARSLYPSGIYRLLQALGGIPKGKCKLMTEDEIKNNKVYYVAEVEVTNIKNNQQISFFNYKTKNGSRLYDGDFEKFKQENPKCKMIIDKFTLEDYVKYQGMEFNFIKGVYWSEFSPIMSEFTQSLYKKRIEYKSWRNDEGDLLQGVVKLILNSMYGKTLLKPSTSRIVFKPNQKKLIRNGEIMKDEEGRWLYESPAQNFLEKNYNTINSMVKGKFVTKFTINANDFNSKNSCHIGTAILSMSKRIMNEVMDVANTKKIEIVYQDTDSMHMPMDKVPLLQKAFHEKFNRELIGPDLGQFHNDLAANFSINGVQVSALDCYSETCIILGKKAYYDENKILESESNIKKIKTAFDAYNKKNNTNKKYSDSDWMHLTQDHIRLKGVGSKSFKKNWGNVKETFEELYNGIAKQFDLAKGYPKFEFRNLNTVFQRTTFMRLIQFL